MINKKQLTLLEKVLFYSAGVTFDLIASCDRSEQDKYKALGLAVILNSFLAFLSGGFFGHSLSNSAFVFVITGVVFSSAMYVIENLILRTMDKNTSILSRIILSICIGLLVSIPMEDVILDGMIQNQDIFSKISFIHTLVFKDPVALFIVLLLNFSIISIGIIPVISKQKLLKG